MNFFLKKKFILNKKNDYKNLINNSNKLILNHIKIYFYLNNFYFPRLGFVLKKKYIKKSYIRNYFKRIIKEFFRLNKSYFSNFDILFMPNIEINIINKSIILNDMLKIIKHFKIKL